MDRLWLRGGFPRAFLAPSAGAASRWLRAFRRTLVERDLPGLGFRVAPAALEQVLAKFGEDDAYFWSTQRGAELDLLLMRRGIRYGFEFKCSDAPGTTKSMRIALSDLGLERLWVLYPGRRSYRLDERIEALPLYTLDSVEERLKE